MDHNSLIDRNTFKVYKHAEDCPEMFICDKMIAPAIAVLNKKGYKTFASCSGHYEITFYEYYDVDINLLDEIKNNNNVIIKEVRKDSFDYWKEKEFTVMYVLFDNDYSFINNPKEFKITKIDDNRISLEHIIDYYDKNGKRRKRIDIENDIEKYSKILKEWANELPERKD